MGVYFHPFGQGELTFNNNRFTIFHAFIHNDEVAITNSGLYQAEINCLISVYRKEIRTILTDLNRLIRHDQGIFKNLNCQGHIDVLAGP